jgi:hypothetical protein
MSIQRKVKAHTETESQRETETERQSYIEREKILAILHIHMRLQKLTFVSLPVLHIFIRFKKA